MGKELQLIKSEKFGEVEADIYSNGIDMFMTIDQLTDCLEYADKSGVEKILQRNNYLKSKEFSTTDRLSVVEGGRNVTRERTVFTEDGIYEVTMLSGQPKAKAFRSWIRKLLKALRKGAVKIIPTRRSLGETNAAARLITQTLKEAGMPPEYRAVALQSLYEPVGVKIPLDGIKADKQLFDCTAIAAKLGIISKSGNPHNQAVAAIIAQIEIRDDEKELVPFQSQTSGHAGPTWQYAESVVGKIAEWLKDRRYPPEIDHNGKSYKVTYAKRQAA